MDCCSKGCIPLGLSKMITITGEQLKKMSKEDFQKYQFCLMRFEISEYVFPPYTLKRAFSVIESENNMEYKPMINKFYMFHNFIEFYYNDGCTFANVIDVNNNSDFCKENNVVWMVNMSNAGIVHFSREPNSFDIVAIHIYKYCISEIEKTIASRYKILINNQISLIKTNCINLHTDIIDILLHYIDLQELIRDYYTNPNSNFNTISIQIN